MPETTRSSWWDQWKLYEITDSLDVKYVQIKDGQDRDLIKVVRRLLLQGFLPLMDDNSRLFAVIVGISYFILRFWNKHF